MIVETRVHQKILVSRENPQLTTHRRAVSTRAGDDPRQLSPPRGQCLTQSHPGSLKNLTSIVSRRRVGSQPIGRIKNFASRPTITSGFGLLTVNADSITAATTSASIPFWDMLELAFCIANASDAYRSPLLSDIFSRSDTIFGIPPHMRVFTPPGTTKTHSIPQGLSSRRSAS